MVDSTTSAYDLVFKYGYDNRGMQSPLDSREFFNRLRSRIVWEYRYNGSCKLIDSLQKQNCNMDIVVCVAIIDANMMLNGQEMSDISVNKHLPHITYPITTQRGKIQICWENCGLINQYIAYQSSNSYIKNLLKEVVRNGKAAHKDFQREHNQKALPTVAQKASQSQGLLAGAQYQSQIQESLEEARAEMARIRAEAAETQRQAKAEAERIRTEAQSYADQIRAEAEALEAMFSGRTAESSPAKQPLETPIKQYFAQDWEELRQSYEENLSAMRQENQAVSEEIERIHERMLDQTNSLQCGIATSISSAIEEMSNMKEELYKKIHDWQVALFPRELEPLAERYVELYTIINSNVPRLLAEEASFQYAQPDGMFRFNGGSDEARSVSDISSLNETPEAAPATIEGLRKLHKTLKTFLQKFESAMKGVGLYVFYPEAGTVFDVVQHMTENDDTDTEGRKIVRCTIPGVAKKGQNGEEDDVVIPATVEL